MVPDPAMPRAPIGSLTNAAVLPVVAVALIAGERASAANTSARRMAPVTFPTRVEYWPLQCPHDPAEFPPASRTTATSLAEERNPSLSDQVGSCGSDVYFLARVGRGGHPQNSGTNPTPGVMTAARGFVSLGK